MDPQTINNAQQPNAQEAGSGEHPAAARERALARSPTSGMFDLAEPVGEPYTQGTATQPMQPPILGSPEFDYRPQTQEAPREESTPPKDKDGNILLKLKGGFAVAKTNIADPKNRWPIFSAAALLLAASAVCGVASTTASKLSKSQQCHSSRDGRSKSCPTAQAQKLSVGLAVGSGIVAAVAALCLARVLLKRK